MIQTTDSPATPKPGGSRGRHLVPLFSLVIMALALSSSALAAPLVTLDWTTKLKHFQVDSDKFVGQRFSFACPARPDGLKLPSIHGAHVYPSGTPLCVAALHAGTLRSEGGRISVQLSPGLDRYGGSQRHGVQSSPFNRTPRSLLFLDESFAHDLTPTERELAPRLRWKTKFTATGLANRKLLGQRFVFYCPEAPEKLGGRSVYGTDRYAFNSLVCLTAVHAGRLTRKGGYVAVQMRHAYDPLEGSFRHGIESKDGPRGDRQLTFLALRSEPTAQSPE